MTGSEADGRPAPAGEARGQATEAPPSSREAFPCRQCGAELNFRPGTSAQACPYCGNEEAIEATGEVRELGLEDHLSRAASTAKAAEAVTVDCVSCGARTSLEPDVSASRCPFCGTPVLSAGSPTRRLLPNGLLPFGVPRDRAVGAFRSWLGGLWFAPGRLKREATRQGRLQGVYVPCWTFDCLAASEYEGLRGDDYWTNESHTATVNRKPVRRTRRVRKTRWTPVRGRVENRFDDVLVLASRSLPRALAERLEPWDLSSVVPYQEAYLAGFRAESYQVGLADGLEDGKRIMDTAIRASVRRDIGGDHQQVHSLSTEHRNVTFKHLLLPVWISTYRWRDRTFRFLVNARTGEVQGERPWSAWKIAGAALAGIALVVLVVWLSR